MSDQANELTSPLPPRIRAVLACGIALQVVLFIAYMKREVEPSYFLHGDPTWYYYFIYRVFDAFVHGRWEIIAEQARTSPWGITLFLQSIFPQLLFGSSRWTATIVNLGYFAVTQIVVTRFYWRLTRSVPATLAMLGLFLSMSTAFRTDGPGLNISDFHFDLILFFMLVWVFQAVASSGCFTDRRGSLLVAVLSAFLVANRLVSAFLLVGVFGAFGAILVLRWKRADASTKAVESSRLRYFFQSAALFTGLSSIPILIARKAVYSHYFRYVFEPAFRDTRVGLYSMGANSKLDEAWFILEKMFRYDIGLPCFVAAAILGAVAWHGRRDQDAANGAGRDTRTGGVAIVDAGLLQVFLWTAIVVSLVEHLAFPIKSDHLTRMTTAPLFVLGCLWIAPALGRAVEREGKRWLPGVAVFGTVAMALVVQVGFYGGPGRQKQLQMPLAPNALVDGQIEAARVRSLYETISHIVHARGMRDVAISVDTIGPFELGAMMSWFTYEYEHHGLLLTPRPQAGSVNDEPARLDVVMRQIADSDFVLLVDGSYPEGGWPFMNSMRTMHADVRDVVERDFCRVRSDVLLGRQRTLWARPYVPLPTLRASASTEPGYGPESLFGSGGRIWHAPWAPGATQSIEIELPSTIQPEAIVITSQDGAPDRAPRSFTLSASTDGREWSTLLDVRGADFTTTSTQRWALKAVGSFSLFRYAVTENGGHPSLLTIQRIALEAPRECVVATRAGESAGIELRNRH